MENIPHDVHVTNLARNFQFCPSLDILKLFLASLCRKPDPVQANEAVQANKAEKLDPEFGDYDDGIDFPYDDPPLICYFGDVGERLLESGTVEAENSTVEAENGTVEANEAEKPDLEFGDYDDGIDFLYDDPPLICCFGDARERLLDCQKFLPGRNESSWPGHMGDWIMNSKYGLTCRQMVQQVTGVRFGNSPVPVVPILKPEPQRLGSRRSRSQQRLAINNFTMSNEGQNWKFRREICHVHVTWYIFHPA